jgi:hypothetical protein
MRFKVTVFAAGGDEAVEGEVIDFAECEQMGTVYVPGATQADAEELAYACVGGGRGWHPVYQTKQIPHLLVVDELDISEQLRMRFHYDYFIEKPVVVDRWEAGSWTPASAEDIQTLQAKYGSIVCNPEHYSGTFEPMNRDELPDWVKSRLAA